MSNFDHDLNSTKGLLSIPIIVLVAGLTTTAIGWFFANKFVAEHDEQRFTMEANHLASKVVKRISRYEDVLLGGVALFSASSHVSRAEWHAYVTQLEVGKRLPGIQGVGFAEQFHSEELVAHIDAMRAEGFVDYKIRPAEPRRVYTSIIYLEPFDWRNRRALGFDMFSELNRRQAMQRARDMGEFAMSGKVELVQETNNDTQAGFLLYHPVYKNGMMTSTVAQRRQALQGYVYSPFRANDLMRGILDDGLSTISFKVYDGELSDDATLLYDGNTDLSESITTEDKSHYTSTLTVEVAGRQWTLEIYSTPWFEVVQDKMFSYTIVGAGLLLSVLMCVIAGMWMSTQRRVDRRTSELRTLELINSRMLENLADGVVACDASGQLNLFNKVARDWHGMDPSQMPQEQWADYYDLFHGDGKTPLQQHEIPLLIALNGEHIRDIEMSIVAKGEAPRFVLVSGGPIEGPKGETLGAVVVMRDLSERKQAEMEVQRQQQFLRQVIDLSPHLIFAKDQQGRFVLANEAVAQFYGTTVASLIGMLESDFNNDKEEIESFSKKEQWVLSFWEDQVTPEEKITGANSKELWMHTVRRPIMSMKDDIELVLGISTDITTQRRYAKDVLELNANLEQRVVERTARLQGANAELKTSKLEAEQANHAKSTFLAAMSHEIRTPMNGIIGMVEVLAHSRLDTGQKDAVHTIQNSAFALLSLIDNVLDFSKIEAGRLDLEHMPVTLFELARETCSSLSQMAHHKGVDLTLYVDPQTPHEIWSDATRLRQVLYNLIGNAIKFSGGREDVRGRVSVLLAASEVQFPHVALIVKDNGIGIESDTVTRLFDSFSQAENSTTRRYGGSGLGLAICKRLVDLMDGEILVESEPGVGSTFTVKLPIDVNAETTIGDLPYVEDLDCVVVPGEFASSTDLFALLKPAGARVHVAKTIAKAIECAKSLPSAIIIIQDFRRNRASIPKSRLLKISESVPEARVLLLTWNRPHRKQMMEINVVMHDGAALEQLSFLKAVAIAAGRRSPEDFVDTHVQALSHDQRPVVSIADARAQGRLILVAEDDSTNQKVILRQLQLLGYVAEVAADGVKALDLWRNNQYALLLTDLHMPDMDGYELTKAIRAEESAGVRLPIIALTANALKGEAIRAKQAGMDDYMTKPAQLQLLETNLSHWLGTQEKLLEAANDAKLPLETSQRVQRIDLSVLTDLVGSDEDTLQELLKDYLHTAKDVACELHETAVPEDASRIKQLAHKLKSSSRAVGALSLGDTCAELENACSVSDYVVVIDKLAEFKSRFVAVEAQIVARLSDPDIGARR